MLGMPKVANSARHCSLRIILQPTGEISWGYHDFDLDCSLIPKLQPVAENILIEHLRTHQREVLQIKKDVNTTEESLEDYLVFHLMDYPAVSYSHFAPSRQKSGGFFYLPVE